MAPKVLAGSPASPGEALGTAWQRPEAIRPGSLVAWEDHEHERHAAVDALQHAARELTALAATLPAVEAEIVEAGALMAHDPALVSAVEEAVLSQGLSAAEAILAATEDQAAAIAALEDEMLAARSDDVRSLGRRAALLATEDGSDELPGGGVVLIARDLGPADVAELASSLVGIALAGGGPTAHAAIVARSLGIPMVTGLGDSVLAVANGESIAIDGAQGEIVVTPSQHVARAAGAAAQARAIEQRLLALERDEPAETLDGHRVAVLANVAGAAEVELALRGGADGVGLLRTELAFLEAVAWPTEEEHCQILRAVLTALGARPAVVRVLDFGADKAPPFLARVAERGIKLLLNHPGALASQLRAIVSCSRGHDVRVLLPLVESPAQVLAVRTRLERAAEALGASVPPLGAMIETPLAAERADDLARVADFFSVGTNDLTAFTLGADRFAGGEARAHDPRVLRLLARAVVAAHRAGLSVEVCGEAASDPLMLPLLVGLGVDELSVGAARVPEVRRWVRNLTRGHTAGLAERALELETAAEVEHAVTPVATQLKSAKAGNGGGERVQSGGGVRALGS